MSLVGGFKHEWIIFHFIWDVIRNPLTNSIIYQDGLNHQPDMFHLSQ